ncbi:MAG TPA: hypothetical protein VKV06_13665 [Acidimicrobiales bacterium]|nr:hypothetical protein [Acidimicrobiales bacterium]
MPVSVPAPARRRSLGAMVGTAAAAASLVAAGCAAAGTAQGATAPGVRLPTNPAWEAETTYPVVMSSPMVATLNRVPSVVVGTYRPSTGLGGKVYAFHLAHTSTQTEWAKNTPGSVGVNSTPSVNGNAIYVSVGNPSAGARGKGGYLSLGARGGQDWFTQVAVAPGRPDKAGVQASMAVGDLNGAKSVVAGSLGQWVDELRSANGSTRPGWPWLATDSSFDTPAIGNLFGSGKNWIVLGNDQTANSVTHEKQGGHLWVLSAAGHSGSRSNEAGVHCQFTPNQGVESSPAVGRFLGGNDVGIVFGTSNAFKGASDTDKLFAVTNQCQLRWKASLDGLTTDSPALVDARNNGHLQVAEGTNVSSSKGTVYLLNGATGGRYWAHDVPAPVIGGITSANVGNGHQDLLVPTPKGLYVLNGINGDQLGVLGRGISLQNSALVTDDSGEIGITVAGMTVKGGNQVGEVATYRIPGTNGRRADVAGAWPMFHHDAYLTGSTLPRLNS